MWAKYGFIYTPHTDKELKVRLDIVPRWWKGAVSRLTAEKQGLGISASQTGPPTTASGPPEMSDKMHVPGPCPNHTQSGPLGTGPGNLRFAQDPSSRWFWHAQVWELCLLYRLFLQLLNTTAGYGDDDDGNTCYAISRKSAHTQWHGSWVDLPCFHFTQLLSKSYFPQWNWHGF